MGGDGWFGGGGGGIRGFTPGLGAGGGGGANYVVRSRTIASVVHPVLAHVVAGGRRLPGNHGDHDRTSPSPFCLDSPCDPGVGRSGVIPVAGNNPARAEAGRVVVKFGADDDHQFPPKPVSDFDGDGQTDIVWQNQGPGAGAWPVRFWLMSGYARREEVTLSEAVPEGLKLVAVGDFGSCDATGTVVSIPDGKPDLVFRPAPVNDVQGPNQTWYMAGTSLAFDACKVPHHKPDGSAFARNSSQLVIAAADFGSCVAEEKYSPALDGRPDIIWQNGTTWNASLNVMDGVVKWFGTPFGPQSPGYASMLVGAADFDANGTTDLVWQAADTRMELWSMAEAVRYQVADKMLRLINDGQPEPLGTKGYFSSPDGTPATDWRLVGIGDFNGDDNPDLLFRHTEGAMPTGKLWVWPLKGRDRIDDGSGLTPGAEGDLNWKVVAPR